MNPTSGDPVPPPPHPPQPHRSSFSCDRHPDEQFTGFCPSCLCERLTTLDQSSSNNNNNPSSSSRRNSASSSSAAAAAAIKSLFSKPSTANTSLPPKPSNKPTSFFPELRRTKSFSASKNDPLSLNFEPQRRSCDVRVRNTLSSLFTLENDDSRTTATASTTLVTAAKASSSSSSQTLHPHLIPEDVTNNVGFVNRPVLEAKEEEEDEDEDVEEESEEAYEDCEKVDNNVVEFAEAQLQQPRISCSEIVEEEEVINDDYSSPLKPIKDYLDLDSQSKKASSSGMREIAGNFWSAASVFSKKWHNWRRKQKLKKQNNGDNSVTLPVEKPLSRQYRETQSEIADYGFGRRSCDTDPRFSLDAGRISFDDPRYSFDEPRASWDGHLMGRSFPKMHPMVSLVEDAPVVHVPRIDTQIPVDGAPGLINCIKENDSVPGGSTQTREYYADSSSRRKKSLDRSSSVRKTAAAVVAEIDEMKAVSNAKVSPENADYFHGAKVMVGERALRDSNSNSLRDDQSEVFELGSLRDNASVVGNGERKGSRKPRKWGWNLWSFIHRRSGGSKDEDDERYRRANGVMRSLSESWQEFRRDGNGEPRGGWNRKVLRSNSSVSWRNSTNFGGSFGSVKKSAVENGHGKKKGDEFILERNRSARYSPNNVDNGLLRFYLTPMRSSRRGGPGKNRLNGSHSIARSVLRLY